MARTRRGSDCWRALGALLLSTAGVIGGPGAQDANLQALPLAALEPDRAFLELRAYPEAPFARQILRVELTLWLSESFADEELLPLFQRRVDLPLGIDPPLPRSSWGLENLGLDPAPAAESASLGLGDALGWARSIGRAQREGRGYRLYQLAWHWYAESPGSYEFAPAQARCSFATRFAEDLILGRRPLDVRAAQFASEPLLVEVRPWPNADRPLDFRGAVGALQLEARAAPLELELGQSLRLELRITGRAPLEKLELPDFEPIASCALRGRLEHLEPGARVLSLDLVPQRSGKLVLPPFELPYLEPGPPARYELARSAALAITVLEPKAEAQPERARARAPSAEQRFGPGLLAAAGGLLLAVLAWLRARRQVR